MRPGLAFAQMPGVHALTDVTGPRISIRPVAGLPLLHIEEPELTGSRRVMKLLFDRSVALAVILLASPLLVGLGLSVRLTSRGPAIFKQIRVGRDGERFTMYKFRTMQVAAEKQSGAVWATANDPRVTPAGKILRQYRLDELPQLFNVLKGDMNIVGPRPERLG